MILFLIGYMLALLAVGGVLWFRGEEASIKDHLARGERQGTFLWTGGSLGGPLTLLVFVAIATLAALVFLR